MKVDARMRPGEERPVLPPFRAVHFAAPSLGTHYSHCRFSCTKQKCYVTHSHCTRQIDRGTNATEWSEVTVVQCLEFEESVCVLGSRICSHACSHTQASGVDCVEEGGTQQASTGIGEKREVEKRTGSMHFDIKFCYDHGLFISVESIIFDETN